MGRKLAHHAGVGVSFDQLGTVRRDRNIPSNVPNLRSQCGTAHRKQKRFGKMRNLQPGKGLMRFRVLGKNISKIVRCVRNDNTPACIHAAEHPAAAGVIAGRSAAADFQKHIGNVNLCPDPVCHNAQRVDRGAVQRGQHRMLTDRFLQYRISVVQQICQQNHPLPCISAAQPANTLPTAASAPLCKEYRMPLEKAPDCFRRRLCQIQRLPAHQRCIAGTKTVLVVEVLVMPPLIQRVQNALVAEARDIGRPLAFRQPPEAEIRIITVSRTMPQRTPCHIQIDGQHFPPALRLNPPCSTPQAGSTGIFQNFYEK